MAKFCAIVCGHYHLGNSLANRLKAPISHRKSWKALLTCLDFVIAERLWCTWQSICVELWIRHDFAGASLTMTEFRALSLKSLLFCNPAAINQLSSESICPICDKMLRKNLFTQANTHLCLYLRQLLLRRLQQMLFPRKRAG